MKALGIRPRFDANARGYQVFYRAGEATRCPGCGRSHWIVRTITAECAFCATALPIAEPVGRGS